MNYTATEYRVLRSAAGYYIGTLYFDEELGGLFPHSRESGYFATKDAAAVNLLDYIVTFCDDDSEYEATRAYHYALRNGASVYQAVTELLLELRDQEEVDAVIEAFLRTPGRVDGPSVHVDGPHLYDMFEGEDEIERARRLVF